MVDTEVRAAPLLLILFCMPHDSNEWLTCTHDNLILRNCCYWVLLTGDKTSNTVSKTIRVPKNQLLTPLALSALLEKHNNGDIYA